MYQRCIEEMKVNQDRAIVCSKAPSDAEYMASRFLGYIEYRYFKDQKNNWYQIRIDRSLEQ